MIDHRRPNPFYVLQAGCALAYRDVVDLQTEHADGAVGNPTRNELINWAGGQILTHPDIRMAWEVLEVPGATYGGGRWEKFSKANRKAPAGPQQDGGQPPVAMFDWAAVTALALEGLLDVQPPSLDGALQRPPVSFDSLPAPLEVGHVLFG